MASETVETDEYYQVYISVAISQGITLRIVEELAAR